MGSSSDFASKWNLMLSLFVDKKDIFQPEVFAFVNELKTQEYIHGTPIIKNTLGQWIDTLKSETTQNVKISTTYRENGNKLYEEDKKLNGFPACDLYTKAIYSAPKGSKELAMAHGNRAASLIELEFYEVAYNDCQSAMDLGYDKTKIDKLLLRQAFCATQLRDYKKLEKSIRTLRGLKGLTAALRRHLDNFDSHLNKLEDFPKSPKLVETEDKKLKVMYSESKGRYLVADEDISKNDTILVDEAFAFVPILEPLDPEFIDIKCHACGLEQIIPFPCYDCFKVSFCSPQCHESHNNIHKYECPGFRNSLFIEVGIAHLSLRVLLVGIDDLIEHLKKRCENLVCTTETIWTTIENIGKTEKFRYAEILRLVSHLDRINPNDYLHFSLTASMLTCYLKNYTTFFEKFDEDCLKMLPSLDDWELIIASLLLKHISQMICNAHSINGVSLPTYFDLNEKLWVRQMHLRVGALHMFSEHYRQFAGIYPKISMCNHSCEPNFRNRFNQISLTIIATKNIKAGEEILNAYGVDYKKNQRSSRLKRLKEQYHFDCDCKHCNDEKDLEYTNFHIYKCQQADCNAFFTPECKDLQWWGDLDNSLNFSCTTCDKLFNYEWLFELKKILSEGDSATNRTRIFEIFKYASKFLIGSNQLKKYLSIIITDNFFNELEVGTVYNKNDYNRMAFIITEWLNIIEEQSGVITLEYVSALKFLLDLLAIAKDNRFLIKIQFDIKKAKASFNVLSDRMKIIFENYVNDYIEHNQKNHYNK